MSNLIKSRLAGMLRGILRRMDSPGATRPVGTAAPLAPVAPLANSLSSSAPHANTPPEPNEVAIPLAPIVAGLPMDLRAKIMAVPPAGMMINLPLDTITSQLAFGAVKISFGELRQLAANIFANSGGEHDNKQVSLPLNEILPRLNPSLLSRRSAVPKVEVANDINGPFGGRGAGIAFTTQPLKAPVRPPAPVPAPVSVAPISKPAPLRMNSSSNPSLPAASIPFTPAILPPVQASRPLPIAKALQPISAAPVSAPAPILSAARLEPAQPTIFASLWDLAENWPDELKNEISSSALANESVPLAGAFVEAGLKRGRVTMSWKQLRTLAKPSSPASPNDNVELDLSLKVIAPIFFAAQKNLQTVKTKATVSSDIPNLFFGFPQATSEAPLSAPNLADKKNTDSTFYVWGDNGEMPKAVENSFAPPPVPQTDFTHRQAQPKDVVARAMALPGMAGAVVTLPDGLRVAGEVPAEFNADTLAAFIPQIFEKMNQSAKELRMGVLNNVSFTVGNIPWRIFRVSSVYFAAFGRAGEALPAAQLAALSGELDRKRNF